MLNGLGCQALQPHQDEVIRKAEALVRKLEERVRHA
jgi:hypothetical protein